MRKFGGVLVAILVLAMGLYLGGRYYKKNTSSSKLSSQQSKQVASTPPAEKRRSLPAVDFDFQDLSGKKYHLSDFKGKVIILNFRRRECPACEYELAFLKSLSANIGGERGIKLIPLFLGEEPAVINRYLKHKNIEFPCYVDSYGLSAYKYRVYAVPTTFIIDKNFNIVNQAVGVVDWDSDEIISWLKKLNNE